MSIIDFLLLLLIAGIIGSLGQALGGYSTPGCAMSIVIGLVGAMIGIWAKSALNLPELFEVQVTPHSMKFPIVWSVLGSAAFVLVLRLLLGRRMRAE